MKAEIESINKSIDALIKANISQVIPTAELNTEINEREAYLFANREALLQIARACLSLVSENLDADGAHIHLDIGNNIQFKSNIPVVLELRNNWEIEV